MALRAAAKRLASVRAAWAPPCRLMSVFPPGIAGDHGAAHGEHSKGVEEMNKEFADVFGEPSPLSQRPLTPRPGAPGKEDPFAVIPDGPDDRAASSASASASHLSHVDAHGKVAMVDVGAKASTNRRAAATALVFLGPEAFRQVAENQVKKGDVLATARTAAISGAKLTSTLIPLCHTIPLSHVSVDLQLDPMEHSVHIKTEAAAYANTGVEMEALTAASVAALTVYDMCKGVDKGIAIREIRLESKTGGKSGTWKREE